MFKDLTTEADVEAYLVKKVRTVLHGKAYKFVSPGNTGVPDRLVCLPGGVMFFVELKAPGRKPSPVQQARQKELEALGASVYGCMDSKSAVDDFTAAWAEILGGAK